MRVASTSARWRGEAGIKRPRAASTVGSSRPATVKRAAADAKTGFLTRRAHPRFPAAVPLRSQNRILPATASVTEQDGDERVLTELLIRERAVDQSNHFVNMFVEIKALGFPSSFHTPAQQKLDNRVIHQACRFLSHCDSI